MHLLEPVDGDTGRGQTMSPQLSTVLVHACLPFLKSIDPHDQTPVSGIGNANDRGTTLQQIGAINNQMFELTQVILSHGCPLQPVSDDPLNRRTTVATVLHQLTNAIALGDPPLEPNALTLSPSWHANQNKRSATVPAQPSLFAAYQAITHGTISATLPTVSFWPITETPQSCSSKIQAYQANTVKSSTLFEYYARNDVIRLLSFAEARVDHLKNCIKRLLFIGTVDLNQKVRAELGRKHHHTED